VEEKLMPRFNATWHWAKLEVPESEAERKKIQSRISKRYPVAKVRGGKLAVMQGITTPLELFQFVSLKIKRVLLYHAHSLTCY
jgi:hypothetical protein